LTLFDCHLLTGSFSLSASAAELAALRFASYELLDRLEEFKGSLAVVLAAC
jgi:hypothetical protein